MSRMLRCEACCLGFFRPSATLWADLTGPMLDIHFILKTLRAAATSSINLFSEVRLPFEILSNRIFESVRKFKLNEGFVSSLISADNVNSGSNSSEN